GPARYELLITDWADNVEVGRSPGVSAGASRLAMVRFQPRPGHAYTARVRWLDGPTAGLKLLVLGGGLGVGRARGSVIFPGDGPEVVTVGAVGEDGRREDYSSCGLGSP